MPEITKKEWEDATNTFVVVMLWTPKPGHKRQTPIVRVAGDYPSYSKAMTVKKKLERDTELSHEPERRTIFVARKFDVEKLDLFNSYVIKDYKGDTLDA